MEAKYTARVEKQLDRSTQILGEVSANNLQVLKLSAKALAKAKNVTGRIYLKVGNGKVFAVNAGGN